MTLQLNETIEGLSTWDDHELQDDTPTNSMLVHFDVVAEEMPFLTEQNESGTVVYKNFVWIFKEKHLGNFQMGRRLRDKVEWDEAQGKWIVQRLHKSQSDIRQYPNEWNAFFRNAKEGGDVGVPLNLLFRQDPSRVAHYARYKINTIERLANLPQMDADTLGMGATNDILKAKNYLARAKEQAPMIQVQAQFAEKDAQIVALLKSQEEQARINADLQSKLMELLQGEKPTVIRSKPKSRQARAKKLASDSAIEGME